MSRRNKFQMIEDAFTEMTLEQQGQILAVMNALYRQKARNGAALADLAKKYKPAAATAITNTANTPLFETPKEDRCTEETKRN